LPPEGVRRRFGEDAWRLHREGRDEVEASFPLHESEERLDEIAHFDHRETSVERLLAWIERLLEPILDALRGRDLALVELVVELWLDRGERRVEHLRPAAPSLDRARILELVRLRLEGTPRALGGGVTDLRVEVKASKPVRSQLELFVAAPRRDLAAASRAIARLRALFGDHAVVRASLREGHLPEALFTWEPLAELPPPEPRGAEIGAFVRRFYDPPVVLPARPRHEPDGWMLRGLEQGPVLRVRGPYIVSGGWWQRAVHREYHFAETQKGEILWVYYDRFRRRWFVQGRVE
ncbi:MAG TPA: DNA polymerase Y family protein, partial [Planctomycetota bacterium]|nr:DNA polymerase Y family protein [Planctomycetota bacterium]